MRNIKTYKIHWSCLLLYHRIREFRGRNKNPLTLQRLEGVQQTPLDNQTYIFLKLLFVWAETLTLSLKFVQKYFSEKHFFSYDPRTCNVIILITRSKTLGIKLLRRVNNLFCNCFGLLYLILSILMFWLRNLYQQIVLEILITVVYFL